MQSSLKCIIQFDPWEQQLQKACIVGCLWVPHPWIQSIMDTKYSGKKFLESFRKQNLYFLQSDNLLSIYIVFTTIYTVFKL